VAACAETASDRYRRLLTQKNPPARHAVHADRLRAIMADLEHLTVNRLPQEMDASRIIAPRRDEIRRIADDLAQDADAIPAMLDDVRIGDDDRALFNRFADDLRTHATTLARAAAESNTEAIESYVNRLLTSCSDCHQTFRVLPTLAPPKADRSATTAPGPD
jgi:hypothetical protein